MLDEPEVTFRQYKESMCCLSPEPLYTARCSNCHRKSRHFYRPKWGYFFSWGNIDDPFFSEEGPFNSLVEVYQSAYSTIPQREELVEGLFTFHAAEE